MKTRNKKEFGGRENVLSLSFSINEYHTARKAPEWELLAPAGSPETFRAVIAAGADAVYVGGSSYGARAYADNFSEEELLLAIDYAHLWGRRVYLTVNTLMKEEEWEHLYSYLLPYYKRGLDAVLVQDFGALSMIHRWFPDLPIHTSTQMTVTGVEGVRFLQQYGVTRVVLARELSLAEMKEIYQETGMELEVFVHGALCYAYSGQCLFSSIVGGRSGNRGRCAQPCRLPYRVTDGNGKELLQESHVLSLKDLRGIEDLDKLKEAGVYSLKIEGRMKQADYAAGVVAVYRKAMDQIKDDRPYSVSRQDLQILSALGNRGVTDCYYHRHNGRDMVTMDKPGYEKGDPQLCEKIRETYVETNPRLQISGKAELITGKPASLCVSFISADGQTYKGMAVGAVVESAQKAPVSEEEIRKRLEKTGQSPFRFSELSTHVDSGIFCPNGVLNRLRRDALADLEKNMLMPFFRNPIQQDLAGWKEHTEGDSAEQALVLTITTRDQLLEVRKRADDLREALGRIPAGPAQLWIQVEMDLVRDSFPLLSDLKKYARMILVLPHIFRRRTAKDFKRKIFAGISSDLEPESVFSGVLVRNYEGLTVAKELFPRQKIYGDHHLYTYNHEAKSAFYHAGVVSDTIPLELNRKEIRLRDNRNSAMVVYGYYPLMISAGCVRNNTLGCVQKMMPGTKKRAGNMNAEQEDVLFLTDRYQKKFPVRNVCSHCYNVIYNCLPTCLFHRMEELQSAGVRIFRLDFTIENSQKTAEVLDVFCNGSGHISDETTNGHYQRGVE